MAKYLTLDGLSRFWAGVKTKLSAKVDKVEGMGLSTNDLTNELKAQYDAAEKNVIVGINVDGEAVTVDEETRTVNIEIPETDLSDYYNKEAIDTTVTTLNEAIAAAASGKMTRVIADSINSETKMVTVDGAEVAAAENVLYFVPRAESDTDNVYEEYMLINDAIELIGTTEIDLSGYVQTSELESYAKTEDIVAVTDEEIDAILAEE